MKNTSHHSDFNDIEIMKEEIVHNLDNPKQLELLYQRNRFRFRKAFALVYEQIQESMIAQVWNERLFYTDDEISWGKKNEFLFALGASLVAALIAKIPQITGIDDEYFYPRHIGFIVFPALMAFFIFKNKFHWKKVLGLLTILFISVIFMNVLPDDTERDTVILSCIHLPLFLWALLGWVFVGDQPFHTQKRIDYLRYNGDLVVLGVILLVSGALLTGLTFGMFELIGVDIQQIYGEYIIVSGLSALPVIATFLVQNNPQLVHKVSPIIAKVFTPLVFVTLIIYLITVIYTGKDPFNDREFLLVFNLMLIGVMALILFSVAEYSSKGSRLGGILLTGLAMLAIIVNGIALSAIVFRISEWGITPNRLAVLGGNLLMLTHLIFVSGRLFRMVKDHAEIEGVEKGIVVFLPYYTIWTIIVTFLFPILFGFK